MKINIECQAHLFKRCGDDSVDCSTPLTVAERRHAIDVALGIIVTMLSSSASVEQLSPLLNYISFSMSEESEAATSQNDSKKSAVFDATVFDANRTERHLACTKACVAVLFLMLSRPSIPGLYESLTSYLSSKDAVCSWILCCLVNTFDDFLRSIGMRFLTAYLEAVSPSSTSAGDDMVLESTESDSNTAQSQDTSSLHQVKAAKGKITKTMKAVGSGFGISTSHMLSSVFQSKASVGVCYKLLWHLLKCHRERLGDASSSAMVNLLVEDPPMTDASAQALFSVEGIVVPDMFPRGYRFHIGWATNQLLATPQLGIDARQNIRNDYAISTFLRLLRFLPGEMKERWLFDFRTLIRVSPMTIKTILKNKDWQPCLFHLLSEIIEEISSLRAKSPAASLEVDITEDLGVADPVVVQEDVGQTISKASEDKSEPLPSPLISRFDLTLNLYASLLGHSIRQGGDNAFQAVEQAASFQRVCVNGHETFSVLLSHVLAELIEKGTIANVDSSGDVLETNRALKNSAKIVTKAILSNGSDGLSMASAVKQWRCLRHLSAVTVAVITSSG